MDSRWSAVVGRIVQVLGIQPGDLVHVRDAAGRLDVLLEISLAIEMQGATPLIEFLPPEYRQRLWNQAPPEYLSHWDRHRSQWVNQADRRLTLAGAEPDWNVVSQEGFRAWQQAVHRLTVAEEACERGRSQPADAHAARGVTVPRIATLRPVRADA